MDQLLCPMVLFIQVNYSMEWKMGMDNKYGRMEASTMDSGKEIKLMVKELWYMLMVIYTKDNG